MSLVCQLYMHYTFSKVNVRTFTWCYHQSIKHLNLIRSSFLISDSKHFLTKCAFSNYVYVVMDWRNVNQEANFTMIFIHTHIDSSRKKLFKYPWIQSMPKIISISTTNIQHKEELPYSRVTKRKSTSTYLGGESTKFARIHNFATIRHFTTSRTK